MDGVDVLDIVFYINKSGYYDDLDEDFLEQFFRGVGFSVNGGIIVFFIFFVVLILGNKFFIVRDLVLFLLFLLKLKGFILKKCRVGVGNFEYCFIIGFEKKGDILNFLIFYFLFCFFVKYGFLFLFFKGNEMEFEGIFLLILFLCVLYGVCFRVFVNFSISFYSVFGIIFGFCW